LVLVGWILSKEVDLFDVRECMKAVQSKRRHAAVGLLLIAPLVFGSWAIDVVVQRCGANVITFSRTHIRAYVFLVCSVVTLIAILAAF
jgi:hypothetical protein